MKIRIKTHHVLRFLAVGLIAASLVGLVPLGYFWWQEKEALASQPASGPSQPVTLPKQTVPIITGQPVVVAIPSLHMNLQIIDGTYNPKSGAWTLTLDKVQFAAAYSEPPNNTIGDTFLYGHYRPEVFAYLHLIKPGAQAIITTDNGLQFSYTFQNTAPFDPSDTSPLANQAGGPPRLTIQTCSGAYMQNRQMYYFTYDGYTKEQ